jgi:hypothetical protein
VAEFTSAIASGDWLDQAYVPEQAAAMLRDQRAIGNASLDQVRSMLTHFVRGERFSDGYWGALIDSGVVRAILERLQQLRG